ncbi:thiamine ABC transporter substrate-binding protein [Deinococcus maricopensis]|uniref:ABC transporter, periplasmic binding protein, thiB subfamily n=1 Tax=Deinococcus maricopensis (strain DSM 21211 / LMG 22137 / NRRL B-23946 / LB-34) TaxID=709986 RepID=E8U653_DEIML|nr:thiamine ABC transporter substrate-binding protein [Deinococcus maricopensis]ADV66542.1 ABC transporter, periplasmic binding protein, thiB subfamily [Deinococcus maricopensis DSM 21211]
MRNILVSVALMAGAAQAATLTVITHDSFDVDKKLVAAFEARTGSKVRFIKGGDAGELLNKLILTRGAPLADVVYGLDNSLLPRARSAGLLEAYKSPALAKVPAQFRLDDAGLLNTVDYGYVALNYDKAYFEQNKLALPKSLEDLAKPEYARLTVVESPATSSTGLAFLLSTVNHLGQDRAMQWWREARANGLRVTRGWSDAYYKDFSRNGGKYPIVLSYASSPAAEVAYSEKPLTASPTANLLLPGSTFLQLEGVGVLKGTKQRALARQFVDFMLSGGVQADFPTRMWVYPAVSGVKLADVWKYAQKPDVTPVKANLLQNPQALVDAWVTQVLRAR